MSSLVSHEDLETIVRISTMQPQLKVDSWNSELLSWQGRRRVFRFFGDADHVGIKTDWSIVLKEIRRPTQSDAADLSEKYWAYWEREHLIYEAGIPKRFDGDIDLPTCYSVISPSTDVRWIWLEDLGHVNDQSWTIATYARTAYQLGRFNGLSASKEPVANVSWLPSFGLVGRSADAVANLMHLRESVYWDNSEFVQLFPKTILNDLLTVSAKRDILLALLDTFPKAFIHSDAWHGNMSLTRRDGKETTILFDWALSCFGCLGEEIANLIWSALLEFKIDISKLDELERVVVKNYLNGLYDVGVSIPEHLIRIAYLIRSVLVFAPDPEIFEIFQNKEHFEPQQYNDLSFEQAVSQSAQVTKELIKREQKLERLINDL